MWFDFNDVRARYLFGGVWCAAVGSALFAALWWLTGKAANIWIVTLVAHGLATTHTFFVQRIYVFRSTDGNGWTQLWRFQLSYLCIGLFTAFFIDALRSQGVHPIAAQILAISLAAVAGYFAGVHFSFADAPIPFWARLKSLIWKAWQIR
jgi:putative flippase GtrA